MEVIVHEYERVDDLQRKGLKIIQNPERFCFGIDAVLLSAFCKVKPGENVLDLGTGTGVIPILLSARTNGAHFTGLEIQTESCEMAVRSVVMNGLEGRISIDNGDIKNAAKMYGTARFDVCTANPPYVNAGSGQISTGDPKAIARHELLCKLEDVIRSASRILKTNGRLYMVHRPNRLADIIALLRECRLEPKKIRFVHPYIHKEPILILIEALCGGRSFMSVMPPLVLYDSDGRMAKEALEIYNN